MILIFSLSDMKKILILLALLEIVLSMPHPPGAQCDTCDVNVCDDTSDCPHGVTKDKCNCCDVCLRYDGEKCGGLNTREGVCDKDFFCHVRHPNSRKNIFIAQKSGKCEPGNI